MMKWTLVGKLIDVGNLPTGTGFVMEVGDKMITVTGLDHGMVQWLAKSYGKDIGLGFDSNEDLKRRSAGPPPETPVAHSKSQQRRLEAQSRSEEAAFNLGVLRTELPEGWDANGSPVVESPMTCPHCDGVTPRGLLLHAPGCPALNRGESV